MLNQRKEGTGVQGPFTDPTEIIEEAPAPGLSMELKQDLAEKAVAAAKAVN
jgi:biotin carboxylase